MFVYQIVLISLAIVVELMRRKAVAVDALSIVNVLFVLCYGVAPIVGYYLMNDWASYSVMAATIRGADYRSSSFYVTGVLSLIAYVVVVTTFFVVPRKAGTRPVIISARKYQLHDRLLLCALILLFFGVLSVIGLIIQTGGVVNWLTSNPRLYFDPDSYSGRAGSWSLGRISKLVLFSSHLLFGLRVDAGKTGSTREVRLLNILLLVSIAVSFGVITQIGGRLVMFRYIAVFILVSIVARRGRRLYLYVLIPVVGYVVLMYGRLLFRYAIYRDHVIESVTKIDLGLREGLAKFFSDYLFVFHSANNNVGYEGEYYGFLDLLFAPLHLLPQSFRPDFVPYASEINTFRLSGFPGESSIPSDIVSYGLINGGWIGVVVIALIFGLCVKIINNQSFVIRSAAGWSVFFVVAFTFGFRVMYCDPAHLLKGSAEVFIGLSVLYLCTRHSITFR